MAKDLLKLQRSPELNLRTLLRPAVFVPESKALNELLRDFRSNRNHLAIVIDEFGNTAGLLTIEDVLEEIVGEIEDEFDDKDGESEHLHAGRRQPARGRRRRRSRRSTRPSTSRLPTDEFDTIGGLVAQELGRVPRRGESVTIGGLRLHGDADARRRGALVQGRRAPPKTRSAPTARRAPRSRRRSRAGRAGRVAAASPRSARCRRSPSSHTDALAAAAARDRAAGLARRRAPSPRRAALLGWRLRHGLAVRRHLVAVRQHAPLRRPAGVAGGAGGAARCRAFLSLYLAAAMAAVARWRRASPLARRALFAGAWLLAELARGVIFTGFPWVASGYAHVDSPLGGLAPWIGVYGIGAVVAGAGRGLRLQPAAASRAPGWRRRGAAAGDARRSARSPAASTSRRPAGTLSVSLLQGNVPQDEKFAAALPAAGAGLATAAQLAGARGDLVVGPETVIPLLPEQLDAGLLAGAARALSRSRAGPR